MSNEFNANDYQETVEAIAKEIIEDEGLEEQDWHDRITQDVDSNSYIIYYAGPPVVKEASNNFPTDMREVCELAGPEADFEKLLQVAAFIAMEADIYQECRNLAEDAEVCEICGAVHFEPLEECNECNQMICKKCSEEHDSTGNILCNECLYDHIEVWDNGGKTIDRYTVVKDNELVFTMNDAPFHPQGFCQFAGERESYPDNMSHCGDYQTELPDAVKEWAQVQAFQDFMEDLPEEPQEDDGKFWDVGPLGSKTAASLNNVHLGEYSSVEGAVNAIRRRGHEDSYFPNVWYISDHGNPILQTDFDWSL